MVRESCAFELVAVSLLDTRCDSADASRCPFAAAAPLVGRKIRGSVAGSSADAIRRTAPAPAAFTGTVATPFAFVRAFEGRPAAPVPASESWRSGTDAPAAESTRIVAVPVFPAPIAACSVT